MDQMTQSCNHKGFERYIQSDPKAVYYYYLALKEHPDIGNTVASHLASNVFADSYVGAVKQQTNTSKKTKSTLQARSEKGFEAVAVMAQVALAKHQEMGPYLDQRTQQAQQTATYIFQRRNLHMQSHNSAWRAKTKKNCLMQLVSRKKMRWTTQSGTGS